MCKKCKLLKSIWWSKQKLIYQMLSERNRVGYGIIEAERDSSWKALYRQTRKHLIKGDN